MQVYDNQLHQQFQNKRSALGLRQLFLDKRYHSQIRRIHILLPVPIQRTQPTERTEKYRLNDKVNKNVNAPPIPYAHHVHSQLVQLQSQ